MLVTHFLVTHFLVTEFLFVLDSLNLSVKEKLVTEKKIPCIFSSLIVVPKFVVTKVIVTEMSYNRFVVILAGQADPWGEYR